MKIKQKLKKAVITGLATSMLAVPAKKAEAQSFLETLGYLAAGNILSTVQHEYGHALAAYDFGAVPRVSIGFPNSGGSSSLGYCAYKGNLNEKEKSVFDVSGIAATRISGEVLTSLLEEDKLKNPNLKKLAAATALMNNLDLTLEVIRGSYNERRDLYKFAEKTDIDYSYLLATGAADFILNFKHNKKLLDIVRGKDVKIEKRNVRPFVSYYNNHKNGKVIFGFKGKF